mgnify:CR=1 FL=1
MQIPYVSHDLGSKEGVAFRNCEASLSTWVGQSILSKIHTYWMPQVQSLMSPNTRKDHLGPVLIVNLIVDKDAVHAAALELMACGSIVTYHRQLSAFHIHRQR